jgi:4a-hydroxytetrahydrobiopterin dehydratase
MADTLVGKTCTPCKVGELAEGEDHHPDVSFGWVYATVSLKTKKIKGLHDNDFIVAAKIDPPLRSSARITVDRFP